MIILTISLITIVAALIYLFLIWNFDYWKKRGVKCPKPTPFLGNYPSAWTLKKHMAYDIDDIYRSYKKEENFVGIFRCRSPELLILNPVLIKRILVTDFKHFHDNETSSMVDEKSDFIFANNPFALTGELWKEKRAQVTPGLTISRIKQVYPITQKICRKLTEYIKKQIRTGPKDGISAKDLSLRYTTEVVTDCVLGLNADSFSEKPTPIMEMILEMFGFNFGLILYTTIVGLFPSLKNYYKTTFVPKKSETFFLDLIQNAIDLRKTQKELAERTDFLNYLLHLQEKKNLTTKDLTAHSLTFLLDGFETSAGVIAHSLLLLARDTTVQEKLRSEIESNLENNGNMSFETVNDLPYLDACIHEAIRVFPPGFFSNKICTEPIEYSNRNGKTLRIETGDIVVLPLYSVMMDEDHYFDAQKYKPVRFLENEGIGLRAYREKGLYYGFGDGPRACIGMRFGLFQTKAALVEIIKNFDIRVNPITRKDNKLDPKNFLPQLDGGIYLDFEPRH